jgi:ribosomal protein L14E/L6E/L27E
MHDTDKRQKTLPCHVSRVRNDLKYLAPLHLKCKRSKGVSVSKLRLCLDPHGSCELDSNSMKLNTFVNREQIAEAQQKSRCILPIGNRSH